MSANIDSIRQQLWGQMRDKDYRDTFVAAHLSTNIAAQIQTLREQRGWSKKRLADEAGMAPARITVMEDPAYEKYSLSTLKRIASAFDVALITRFVPFSDLVDWVADLSPEKMEAVEFEKDNFHKKETSNFQLEGDSDLNLFSEIKPIIATVDREWPGISALDNRQNKEDQNFFMKLEKAIDSLQRPNDQTAMDQIFNMRRSGLGSSGLIKQAA